MTFFLAVITSVLSMCGATACYASVCPHVLGLLGSFGSLWLPLLGLLKSLWLPPWHVLFGSDHPVGFGLRFRPCGPRGPAHGRSADVFVSAGYGDCSHCSAVFLVFLSPCPHTTDRRFFCRTLKAETIRTQRFHGFRHSRNLLRIQCASIGHSRI